MASFHSLTCTSQATAHGLGWSLLTITTTTQSWCVFVSSWCPTRWRDKVQQRTCLSAMLLQVGVSADHNCLRLSSAYLAMLLLLPVYWHFEFFSCSCQQSSSEALDIALYFTEEPTSDPLQKTSHLLISSARDSGTGMGHGISGTQPQSFTGTTRDHNYTRGKLLNTLSLTQCSNVCFHPILSPASKGRRRGTPWMAVQTIAGLSGFTLH